MYGAVAMIPYYLGFALFVFLAARTRYKAPFYLYMAAILCGLSVLAKGLAGLGLPVIVFVAYLAFTWNWRRLRRAQLRYGDRRVADRVRGGGGAVAPRDDHPPRRRVLERAVRRQPLAAHGDRPPRRPRHVRVLRARAGLRPAAVGRACARRRWAGRSCAAARSAAGGPDERGRDARKQGIIWLGAIWFVAAYALVSLSMTKFHHYVLPAIPGLAIVIGCFIDELCARGGWRRAAVVALVGLPLLALVAIDLRRHARTPRSASCGCSRTTTSTTRRGRPWPDRLDFSGAADRVLRGVRAGDGGAGGSARPPLGGGRAVACAAVVFTFYLLDGFMRGVAPSWSQKGPIATYYRNRRSPGGTADRLPALLARRDLLHLERDLRRADRGADRVRPGRRRREAQGLDRRATAATARFFLFERVPAGAPAGAAAARDARVASASSTTRTTSSPSPQADL